MDTCPKKAMNNNNFDLIKNNYYSKDHPGYYDLHVHLAYLYPLTD